jgi:hypothetical protein
VIPLTIPPTITLGLRIQLLKCNGHEFLFTLVKFIPIKFSHFSIIKCSLAPELLKAVEHPGVPLPNTYETFLAQVSDTKKEHLHYYVL